VIYLAAVHVKLCSFITVVINAQHVETISTRGNVMHSVQCGRIRSAHDLTFLRQEPVFSEGGLPEVEDPDPPIASDLNDVGAPVLIS